MPRNASGGSTLGTLRCKTDLGLILDAIAEDIEYGGNAKTVQAFKFYLGANGEILHIRLQLLQSLYTHERLAFYAKAAIDGTLVTVHSNAVVIPPAGITNDAGGCANVKTAIDTLFPIDICMTRNSLYAIEDMHTMAIVGYSKLTTDIASIPCEIFRKIHYYWYSGKYFEN